MSSIWINCLTLGQKVTIVLISLLITASGHFKMFVAMAKAIPRKPLIFPTFKGFQTLFKRTLLRYTRVLWLHTVTNSFGSPMLKLTVAPVHLQVVLHSLCAFIWTDTPLLSSASKCLSDEGSLKG